MTRVSNSRYNERRERRAITTTCSTTATTPIIITTTTTATVKGWELLKNVILRNFTCYFKDFFLTPCHFEFV